MHMSMTTTNITIIMMTNVAAVMIMITTHDTRSMSIITNMMRTAPADATIMTMNTIMITTMKSMSIIMNMMRTAPADAMTIITDTKDIIMQMEVFTSWGKETAHKYTEEELDYLLKALFETDAYGTVLRSKGIIQMADGSWKQFDMVPEEYEVREDRLITQDVYA